MKKTLTIGLCAAAAILLVGGGMYAASAAANSDNAGNFTCDRLNTASQALLVKSDESIRLGLVALHSMDSDDLTASAAAARETTTDAPAMREAMAANDEAQVAKLAGGKDCTATAAKYLPVFEQSTATVKTMQAALGMDRSSQYIAIEKAEAQAAAFRAMYAAVKA